MLQPRNLWVADLPMILASNSATRSAALRAVGLPVRAIGADIDERAIESAFLGGGGDPSNLAAHLAQAKALAVSRRHPKSLCLGADQTLILGGEIFHKSAGVAAAAENLSRLAGKTHILTSAACIARVGVILHESEDSARMSVRKLTPAQIQTYLTAAGDAALASVGGYQIEGLGLHLFERVDGDHATILGLPLMKLLSWFRSQAYLAL